MFDQFGNLRGIASAIDNSAGNEYFYRMDLAWNDYVDGAGSAETGFARVLSPLSSERVIAPRDDTSRSDNIQVQLSHRQFVANGGESFSFRYLTENAVQCQATSSPRVSGWDGPVPPSNGRLTEVTLQSPGGTQQYTLTCTNALGGAATRSITITGSTAPDQDGDGIPDANDSCPASPNADQGDADADGIGNACDGDNPSASVAINYFHVNNSEATTIDVPLGSWAQLSWNSSGATDCVATGGNQWQGAVGSSGVRDVSIGHSDARAYALTCSGGGASATITRTIRGVSSGGGSGTGSDPTPISRDSGGGAASPLSLLALLVLSGLRRYARTRTRAAAEPRQRSWMRKWGNSGIG